MNQPALIQQNSTIPAVATTMTPATLLQIAIEKDADMDKLEKLMDMQERWEAKEAKKAFTRAMSDFRANCPSIHKTEQVDFKSKMGRTQYKHASLAGTIEQIKEQMTNTGLSHSWRIDDNERIKVTCIVTHEDGHSESTSLTAPSDQSGGKNAIQAIASTVSYLERYTLFAILGLASKEMDTDGITEDDKREEVQPAKKIDYSKMAGRVAEHILNNNLVGFYTYMNATTPEQQTQIFNLLPDKSKNKTLYREMEKKAADMVNIYGNQIEDYAVKGDIITAVQLIDEIKSNEELYSAVWSELSDNCKDEIKNLVQE